MKIKLLSVLIILALMVSMGGCIDDPLTEDLYTTGNIYSWNGTAWEIIGGVGGSGNVSVWGDIGGVLANQADLQNELNAVIAEAIGTTKGDIIVFTGAGAPIRLGVGGDTLVLTADSLEPSGIKWGPVVAGAHDLGGASHNADTLANLNAKVNDATLIANTTFDATTFLYATVDDTPQVKTPVEVMVILSGQAGGAFDWNGQNLTSLGSLSAFTLAGTVTLGGQHFDAGNTDLRIDTTGAPKGLHLRATNINASGSRIKIERISTSPAINDKIVEFEIEGRDSNGNATDYGYWYVMINNPVDGSETSSIHWDLLNGGGVVTDAMLLSGAGDLTLVGDLTAANIITAGDVDGRDVSVDGLKLDGIEALADITDTANVDGAGATMNADWDVKGDILVATADNTPTNLGVGADGTVLTADSTQATGTKWAVSGGGADVKSGTVNNVQEGVQTQVNFNTAFSSTPHVVATVKDTGGSISTTLCIEDITVNSFKISTKGDTADAYWIATNGGNP